MELYKINTSIVVYIYLYRVKYGSGGASQVQFFTRVPLR